VKQKIEEYLPVNLALEDKNFLVVGGGKVASRKINLLVPRGTHLTVVAKEPDHKIRELEKNSLLILREKEYEDSDLENMDYVIVATDDKDLNERIYEECKKRTILVNVVDDPKHCDFIFPSILRRGTVTFTVSTAGKSPFLSAFLRQIMENAFTEEWVFIGDLAAKYRKYVMRKFKDREELKSECFKRFLDVNWMEIMRQHDEHAAEDYYNKLLDSLEEI
jgi:precorrin-2 dehydrogenase/sirohydrochlorin ferrochelatase